MKIKIDVSTYYILKTYHKNFVTVRIFQTFVPVKLKVILSTICKSFKMLTVIIP